MVMRLLLLLLLIECCQQLQLANHDNGKSNRTAYLDRILQYFANDTTIVSFKGARAYKELSAKSAFIINGDTVKNWENVAKLINKSSALPHVRNLSSILVHNELKVGDFLHLITHQNHRQLRQPSHANMTKQLIFELMDFGQRPITLTNNIDENWGFFSTYVINRTTRWINMSNHLRIHQHSYSSLSYFINSPKIVAVFGSNHVDPIIGFHSKILSLPLGVSAPKAMFSHLLQIKDLLSCKDGPPNTTSCLTQFGNKLKFTHRLLYINNSGWKHRKVINQIVSDLFNDTVNSYVSQQFSGLTSHEYLLQHYLNVANARFVLSPSGMGYDTYRLWESILLGSIPIVESNTGFDRTYSSLPVLVVQSFSQLSTQLLEGAFTCFETHRDQYRYEHLTHQYWIELIDRVVLTGDTSFMAEQHPPINMFCNFLNTTRFYVL